MATFSKRKTFFFLKHGASKKLTDFLFFNIVSWILVWIYLSSSHFFILTANGRSEGFFKHLPPTLEVGTSSTRDVGGCVTVVPRKGNGLNGLDFMLACKFR